MSDDVPCMGEHRGPDISEDEDILNYTIARRLDLAANMTAGGRMMPNDNEDRKIYLDNLAGLERIAISRMRIKSDEKVAGSQAEATAYAIAMLAEIGKGGAVVQTIPSGAARETPQLPVEIPEPVLVPGEIGTAEENLDYETLMGKQ